MSLADVRTIMGAAIEAALGIKCTGYIPSVIHPPLAILRPLSGNWDTNLPRNVPRRNFELSIVIPAAMLLEEAQKTLDSYLETNKVKDAVEKANYAGNCDYARVVGWRDYGETIIDQYIGIRFDIMVI